MGKTSVLAELQKYGFVVIDLDATGICRWRNKTTKEFTEYGPSGRDPEWLAQHEWYCDVSTLKTLLSCIREDKDIFVAAMPHNVSEFAHDFDKIFLLTANEDVIRKRLAERKNNHFARKEEEQEFVLKSMKEIISSLKDFTEVDSQSPETTAKEILTTLDLN